MQFSPLLALSLPLPALAAQDVDEAFFEGQVLPILEANCFECHGPGADVKASLRLTSAERVHRGGDRGPVIDLERPEASLLLRSLAYQDEHLRMPPAGKLPAEQVTVLTRWVEAGAPWSPNVVIEVEEEEVSTRLTKGAVGDPAWVTNPLAAIVLARLEAARLSPTREASRRVLLRRVTFDLTGLPPSPDELAAFLADETPEAWDRVIDRLLASPHYGERWGRHWLDLVRYAETNGYERDSDKPNIWRYRDYVIDAFNRDLPYDQFIIEQLAGDEIADPTPESITATGFTRLMIWDDEPGNGREQARYDELDDLVRATSEGFLGMTMGCARCHDHKGDPISAKEYYSFMAYFEGLAGIRREGTLVDISTAQEQAQLAEDTAQHDAELDRLTTAVAGLEQTYRRRAMAGGVSSGLSDLTYRFYRDTWNELPDFDMLRAEDEGELAGNLFDLSPATREEAYGFVFEGFLSVPHTGDYRFVIDSDDGARLSIDGEKVVERDGTHALGDPQTGVVQLEAGRHPVRLDFFQWTGGAAVDLTWEPVGGDTWRYTTEDPGASWGAMDFDDAAWTEGVGGFGTDGTPGAEVGTEWSTPAIWLRRTFTWDADDAEDLVLVVHHDEDVEVLLNGVPAFSRGGARGDYTVFDASAEARAAVRKGTNLLAVRCRQTGGGQYVHVRPVHRSDTLGNPLDDLAFGRRPLSASTRPESNRDLTREIEQRGGDHLSQEELGEWQELRKQRDQLKRSGRPRPAKLAFAATTRGPDPPQMHVHIRGSVRAKGSPVEPGVPGCLEPSEVQVVRPEGKNSSGRRLALARWIASPGNPLTARVMVNRLWLHYFGRGLVPSPNDFGEFGERPTHPALLDWLGSELVARGWSVKEMHRVILRSSTYRMGYRPGDARTAKVDPNNDLLWRHRMRRLSAEEMRDSILWLTGKLSSEMGGPSFYSMISSEARATSSRPNDVWRDSPEEQRLRRSVYIKVKRSLATPMLEAFDLADMDSPCAERFTTTQPAQALSLLNGEFANVRAADIAHRLEAEHPGEPRAQLARLVQLALSRPAEEAELDELEGLRVELLSKFGLDEHRALANCCLLVINVNEFAYVE
jgi:mono/diheme cytochrome c family protein